MVKVIETNLSIGNYDEILDHQSRVIEVESWEHYVEEIKNAETVIRKSVYGSLHGNSVPRESRVDNLKYDDFHLSCNILNDRTNKTKKLAYLIDKE